MERERERKVSKYCKLTQHQSVSTEIHKLVPSPPPPFVLNQYYKVPRKKKRYLLPSYVSIKKIYNKRCTCQDTALKHCHPICEYLSPVKPALENLFTAMTNKNNKLFGENNNLKFQKQCP